LPSKNPARNKIKEQDFVINLGPWALTVTLRTLEFLGTHFKTPLGTKNLFILKNLTV